MWVGTWLKHETTSTISTFRPCQIWETMRTGESSPRLLHDKLNLSDVDKNISRPEDSMCSEAIMSNFGWYAHEISNSKCKRPLYGTYHFNASISPEKRRSENVNVITSS